MAGDSIPEIGGFLGSPPQVPLGNPVSLVATGVTAPSGRVVSEVSFFRDVDRNGQWTAADGAALGIDTNGANGWNFTTSIVGLAAGDERFFAVAMDSTGAQSQPASTSVTILSPTRILDDGESGFSIVSGTWQGPSNGGYANDHYFSWFNNGVVEWRFPNVVAGTYTVSATWTNGGNRALAAPYEIIDGTNGLATVLVNQRNAPLADATAGGRNFQDLGTFELVNGQFVVRVTNTTASSLSVDAIRLEHIGPARGTSEIRIYDGSSELVDGTSTINLGSTFIGTEVPKTLTVQNVGVGTLNLTQLTQAAMPAGYRLVSGYGSTTLAQGQSTTFTVALAAQAIGTAAGNLSIMNDDPDEGPFDVQLTGIVNSSTVKDDDDPGYVVVSGTWQKSHSGFNNDHAFSWFAAGAVEWRFGNLLPGEYQVSGTWTNATNRALAAPYTITGGANGPVTAIVNQRNVPAADATAGGRNFQNLGRLEVTSGGLVVRLTSNTASSFSADAIRLEYLRPLQTLPEIRVFEGASELVDAASSVNVGSTFYGTALPPKTLTVSNAGVGSLVLTQLTQAAMPAGFQLVSGFGSTTLAPGASTTFSVAIDPTNIGSRSGVLSILSNDSDETPFEITLSGVVTNSKIIDDEDFGFAMVSSQSWAEGSAGYGDDHRFEQGATGGYVEWTIANLLPGQYRVSTTWVEGADRSARVPYTGFDGSIDVGTAWVNQRVAPVAHTVINSRNFQILGSTSIVNGSLVLRMANISGDGRAIADAIRIEYLGPAQQIADIRVFDGSTELVDAVSAVNLGEAFFGSPSATKTLTVRNVGLADLVLTPLTQAAMPAGVTLVSSFATTTLARGQSTTFQVRLAGTSLGPVSGVLSLLHNDADETPFEIALSGVVSNTKIIDDEDAGFVVVSGTWQESPGGFGDDQYVSSLVDGAVEWQIPNLVPGRYRISATWPHAANFSTAASYAITGGSTGVKTVLVDQTTAPRADATASGRNFEDLGTFHVFEGRLVVRLTGTSAASVSADAIRLEYLGAPIPSEIASFAFGQLNIVGTAANDTVAIGTVNLGGVSFVVVNGQMVGEGVRAADVLAIVADLGAGDDTINLSSLDASVFTGLSDGAVTIHGGAGNDAIQGTPLADVLHGEDGDDEIRGHGGNDTINGGNGSDTLVGGDGDDTYLIGGPGDSGTDLIDEAANGGNDRVDLTGFSPLQRIEAGSTDVQPVTSGQALRFVNANAIEAIPGNRPSASGDGIYTVPGDPSEMVRVTLRLAGYAYSYGLTFDLFAVDADGNPVASDPHDPTRPGGFVPIQGMAFEFLPNHVEVPGGTRLGIVVRVPDGDFYSIAVMNDGDEEYASETSTELGETLFSWDLPPFNDTPPDGTELDRFNDFSIALSTDVNFGTAYVYADPRDVIEGEVSEVTFTFDRAHPLSTEEPDVDHELVVMWWPMSGLGKTGSWHYGPRQGGASFNTLVIPAGARSKTLTIPIIDDDHPSVDSRFGITSDGPFLSYSEAADSPYQPFFTLYDDDKVDLDVDSDNTGPIDGTAAEEAKEEQSPGKIIAVGGARAKLTIAHRSDDDLKLTVASGGVDKVRFWTSEYGGSEIPYGSDGLDSSYLEGSSGWQTIWVEAIKPSETAGDIVVTLQGPDGSWDSDTVRLTSILENVNIDAGIDLEIVENGAGVSADYPGVYVGADVMMPQTSSSTPSPVPDGTRIEWTVERSDGSEYIATTTTVNGFTSFLAPTGTNAGVTCTIRARFVPAPPAGVPAPPEPFPVDAGTVTVLPGDAAVFSFAWSKDAVAADATSEIAATVTVRDRSGNLVSDGTPISWSTAGAATLVSGDSATTNGLARVRFRAQDVDGQVEVTATADGANGTSSFEILGVNVTLVASHTSAILGSDDEVEFTATVKDTTGQAVADGTPVHWYSRSGRISGDATVVNGQAKATLTLRGGVLRAGDNLVAAFVQRGVGKATVQLASADGKLFATVGQTLLAGDVLEDGTGPVEQLDGTEIDRLYYYKTAGYVFNAPANGVVRITLDERSTALGLVTINGNAGYADIPAGPDGTVSFVVRSTGQFEGSGAVRLRLFAAVIADGEGQFVDAETAERTWGGWAWDMGVATAKTVMYVHDTWENFKWGAITGEADTNAALAGDLTVSFVPGVGILPDLRDVGKEVAFMLPGGREPNYFVLSAAAMGVFMEFLPAADYLTDVLTKLAKVIRARALKSGSADEAVEYQACLLHLLPPDVPTLKFLDDVILKSADDLAALNRVSKTLDPGEVIDLLKDVGARHGATVASRLFFALKGLSNTQLATLKAGNKLAIVAEAVAKADWGPVILSKYADDVAKLGAINPDAIKLFDEFARVPGSGTILKTLGPNSLDDAGVQLELTVAKRLRDSGDEVTGLQRKTAGVVGEIDVVTRTRAVEVKTTPANEKPVRFKDQATRLKKYAEANGLQAEYWFKNSIRGDQLEFLEQLGIRPVLIQ